MNALAEITRSITANPQTNGATSSLESHWLPEILEQPGFNLAETTDDNQRILAAAVAILMQGEELVCALSAESYTQRVPFAFNASIGGHYRHCLDHFTSLLQGVDQDEVNYDHRARDVRIESQPNYALDVTRQLRERLQRISLRAFDSSVRARCEVSYAHGGSPVTASTFGREMVYAIAHAIHHYALISVMARLLEVKLPEHFGVAPSTVAHQKSSAAK